MPVFVMMPLLSPTMEKGNLVKWCKKVGEQIAVGDVIAEIDTDKATMEVEALHKGILAKILVEEGTHNVLVKTPIAIIKQSGDTDQDIEIFNKVPVFIKKEGIAEKEVLSKEKEIKNEEFPVESNQKKVASPLARRIASMYGIDINSILKGSGPGGRITKIDILDHKTPEEKEEKASGLRMAIVDKLTKSKQEIPHYYMRITANVTTLHKIIMSFKESSNLDIKITINEFIIKAVAMAMEEFPIINSSWNNGSIKRYGSIDVAFAVSVEDGLYSPVIQNTDKKNIKEIAKEVRELAAKAKNKTLKPSDYTGGGITISNLGMIDIDGFFSIINPPQASIISVPKVMKTPIVDDYDNITVGYILTLGYAIDHRVIDGKPAAIFLSKVKQLLENPLLLLI